MSKKTAKTNNKTRRSESALPLLTAQIFGCPLMIEQTRWETILKVIAPKLGGGQFAQLDRVTVETDDEDDEDFFSASVPAAVGVVPIHGTLVHRHGWVRASSGLLPYDVIRADLIEARDSDSIESIILDIDSPGGEVSGVFDLAALIKEIDQVKPVYAFVNEQAFSAAYLLASAARKIIVPTTGNVGSIGVIATHYDQSIYDENIGLKVTHIYAGEKKADLSPHVPLSESAKRDAQAGVNTVYEMFVSFVAESRGLETQAVVDTKAQLFIGKSATNAGLADHIGNFSEALRLITQETSQMSDGNKAATTASAENTNGRTADTPQAVDQTASAPEAPVAEAPEAPAQAAVAPAVGLTASETIELIAAAESFGDRSVGENLAKDATNMADAKVALFDHFANKQLSANDQVSSAHAGGVTPDEQSQDLSSGVAASKALNDKRRAQYA